MKCAIIVLSLAFLAIAYAQTLPDAQPCSEATCRPPNCRCSTTNIPGGLAARNTPQFVLVTFDDGVNVNNIVLYRQLLRNRFNSNNCPAVATFFVTHEYTDYTLVNELYNDGHEIALHSISHTVSTDYWRNANYSVLMSEFADQVDQISHFANIPANTIHGIRLPFLQMNGNASFQMMQSAGLTYDSSWPTSAFVNPGLWPYTLDYLSVQDCIIPPCPTAAIPGPWVKPMISWLDLNGLPCSMVDTCFNIPHGADEEGWFRFILNNFERHYLGNRAPFGFYVHEWFVRVNPGLRFALERFLNMINSLHDVYMVNANEVLDWVQNPVPVNEFARRSCRTPVRTTCPVNACGPLEAEHTDKVYYMRACASCPRVYPWLNNPLGR